MLLDFSQTNWAKLAWNTLIATKLLSIEIFFSNFQIGVWWRTGPYTNELDDVASPPISEMQKFFFFLLIITDDSQ